jgi:DNA polymerase-1
MVDWLLLDCHNLCYRAFHSTGHLRSGNDASGVLFGFFQTILSLGNHFPNANCVFCFDKGTSLRKEIYPAYKADRKRDGDPKAFRDMRKQMARLRQGLLRKIGYRNVFYQEGLEGDDIIAHVCEGLTVFDTSELVIVSNDRDLVQLLGPRTSIWNPIKKKILSHRHFVKEFRFDPAFWPDRKALAGGKDNIKGVEGIGPRTAEKFLAGRLEPGSKLYDAIVHNNKRWRWNLRLTQLPLPGSEFKHEVVPDKIDPRKWNRVMKSLGIKRLRR